MLKKTCFYRSFKYQQHKSLLIVLDAESNDDKIAWLESEEILLHRSIENIDNLVTHASIFICGDVEISYVKTSEALANIYKVDNEFKSAVELAEKEHSDLVAGKYEGTSFDKSLNCY